MLLSGALLNPSALQDTVSAAGEFPHALLPEASASSQPQGTKSQCLGCEGEPWPVGGWSQGVLQSKPHFSSPTEISSPAAKYLPAAEGRSADPSPAGLLGAATKCCQVGNPSVCPRGHEGSIFRKIFQGTRQAFKALGVCCSLGCPTASVQVCGPYCRIALRQSAAGGGFAFIYFFKREEHLKVAEVLARNIGKEDREYPTKYIRKGIRQPLVHRPCK